MPYKNPADRRAWRKRNRDKIAAYRRAWRSTPVGREQDRAAARKWHHVHKPSQREKGLKRNYGLTNADFDKMMKAQGGKCAICDRDNKYLVVDHCHKTGNIRKLLCNPCNSYLGVIEANPGILERVKEYLCLLK